MKAPQIKEDTKDKLIKVGVGLLLFFVAKKAITEAIEKQKKKNSESNIDNNPDAAQAFAIKMALNPSGMRWLFYVDSVNETELYKQAQAVQNLEAVAKHYKSLSEGTSLYDDINSKLSPEKAQKFLSIASKGKTGNKNYVEQRDDVPAGHWVLTARDTNVRKSPKWQHPMLPFNNIRTMIKPGSFIGRATGKTKYDEFKDVVFIELAAVNDKNEKRIYYVAKSQVELLSDKDKQARQKKEQLKHLAILDGVHPPEQYRQHLISITGTPIMNEQLKVVGTAPKGVILGFPVMTLNTGRGKIIQFTTVQGRTRWVKAEHVSIQDIKK